MEAVSKKKEHNTVSISATEITERGADYPSRYVLIYIFFVNKGCLATVTEEIKYSIMQLTILTIRSASQIISWNDFH